MVLLDSVGAELVRRHGGTGDKFTSGAAGRLVYASASGGVLCGGVFVWRSDGQQMYWCSLMYLRGGVRGKFVWREAGRIVRKAGGRGGRKNPLNSVS
jgi:hypothetical protein